MEKENPNKETLTNEKLSKKFVNQFDLVNYAISLADNMIKSGRAPRVKVDVDNPVIQVLAEIEQGKDYLEEIAELIPHEIAVEEVFVKYDITNKDRSKGSISKSSEKRKSRIM